MGHHLEVRTFRATLCKMGDENSGHQTDRSGLAASSIEGTILGVTQFVALYCRSQLGWDQPRAGEMKPHCSISGSVGPGDHVQVWAVGDAYSAVPIPLLLFGRLLHNLGLFSSSDSDSLSSLFLPQRLDVKKREGCFPTPRQCLPPSQMGPIRRPRQLDDVASVSVGYIAHVCGGWHSGTLAPSIPLHGLQSSGPELPCTALTAAVGMGKQTVRDSSNRQGNKKRSQPAKAPPGS